MTTMAGIATSGRRRNAVTPYLLLAAGASSTWFSSSSSRCTPCSGCRCRARGLGASDPTSSSTGSSGELRRRLLRLRRPVLPVVLVRGPGHADLRCSWLPARVRHRVPGGPLQELLLGLVVLPFFMTSSIRTLAWKTILADEGWVVVASATRSGSCRARARSAATPWAVIGGLTYNFLPFMVLPIYVSLEKIDPRLVEAARDLYSNTFRALPQGDRCRCRCPACSPAACSCSSPPAGDFVNAQYLGGTQHDDDRQRHPEPVPRGQGLPGRRGALVRVHGDHPGRRVVYTRVLGTEDLV